MRWRTLLEFLAFVVLLFGLGCAVSHLCGCIPPASTREAAAEATYLGQQLRCVDEAETRQQADDCRRRVRERWGVVEVSRDAGVDR